MPQVQGTRAIQFNCGTMRPLLAAVVAAAIVVSGAAGTSSSSSNMLQGRQLTMGLPGCTTHCGNVSVPYPFGIEHGCYLEGFNVTCNATGYATPRLVFWMGTIQYVVTHISLDRSTTSFLPPHVVMTPSLLVADTNWTGAENRTGCHFFYEKLKMDWELGSKVLAGRGRHASRPGNETCPKDLGTGACHSRHGTCRTTLVTTRWFNYTTGYVCKCDKGFQGNPYLPDGCQDVDECAIPDKCYGKCTNLHGSYWCQCPKGTSGNPKVRNGCISPPHPNTEYILSQINHRNIVKLQGCCLETQVPLLVYEFISNGTLYNHLHVETSISLSWRDRFRIAVETTRALAYLHSLTSMPIIHRDVKSPNILLDDNLIVKLSDFGASRYIPINQSGLNTTVQGTFGYLDPMYHSTGHLTKKSDVYSFGVLLIELLTRKKPVSYRSIEGHSLVYHFVTLLSKGSLSQILDPQVNKEGDGEVVDIALLAAICVKHESKDRPTMRQVEMTLESIYAAKEYVSSDMTDDQWSEEITNVEATMYTNQD